MRMGWTVRAMAGALASLALASLAPRDARAEEAVPAELQDVGIEEHLGQALPMDATFRDEAGRPVAVRDIFAAGKPVILNFAYFRCPMMCNLVLKGLVEGMKGMDWVPGGQFEVLTLSIDPTEGPEQAAAKKRTHVAALGKPEAAAGWHFLTGKEPEIKRLAEAAGFRYKYIPATKDYAHGAGLLVATPQGTMSRYLYGVDFKPKDLRLALMDATEGKALSLGDKLLLFCYHYDPQARGYVLFARHFMMAGGYVVMAGLFALLGGLWIREARRRKPRLAPRQTVSAPN